MNAVYIIGCTLGGALLGGIVGAYMGDQGGGDDLGFGVMLYGGVGMLWGGLGGCVLGAVLFT